MREDGTSGTKSGDSNANVSKDQPVTISAPPAAAVTIDPQNPLPEPSFFWRRWITIVLCANALTLAWFTAAWLYEGSQWDHLYSLTRLMIYGAGLVLTYYFVAPSAAELTNLVQSASIIRHSLSMAGSADKRATDRAESYAQRRFEGDKAPEGPIPASAPGEAPSGPGGDVGVEATPDDIPADVGASDPSSR